MNNEPSKKILAIAKVVEATNPKDWVVETATVGDFVLNKKLKTSINNVDFVIETRCGSGNYRQVIMFGKFLIHSPTIDNFIDRLIKYHNDSDRVHISHLDYCYNQLIPNEQKS